MRVYLPATSALLERLVDRQVLEAPLTAFAVTPALREWYLDEDVEDLEYAAMLEAARASLRLLDADPSAARRRVVIALDAPDAGVSVRDDLDRGVVRVADSIGLSQIAAVHLDESGAEAVVTAAAGAINAADLGEQSAQDVVDDAEGFELCWYASQEIETVLATLPARPNRPGAAMTMTMTELTLTDVAPGR